MKQSRPRYVEMGPYPGWVGITFDPAEFAGEMKRVCEMTDADLARQEWLDERAAVLEFEAKFSRHEAERLALVMWEAKVQRENASGSYGDAPGAHGSDAVGGTEGAATTAARRPGRT